MKKLSILLISSFLLLSVVGCSDNDEGPNPSINDEPAVENELQEEESSSDKNTTSEETTEESSESDALNFKDFELEVDYAQNKEYEAEYELDNGNIETEIEDDLNDVNLKGEEALKELEPLLQKLNIAHDTPKEKVIKEALDIFDLPEDYIKFELEITFDDDTEIEFKDIK